MKTGILFAASVGTSEETLTALSAVERLATDRAWGHEIRWGSLTPPCGPAPSGRITPVWLPLALQQMEREGFTHVVIQPLQVVSGIEFRKLEMTVTETQRTSKGTLLVAVGAPLLGCVADLERVARALLENVSGIRRPGDALILIAHGSTDRTADLEYLATAWVLESMDRQAFMGCVNGMPDVADVIRRCQEAGVKRAILMPLTLAAGSTVREALAKTGTQSWIAALGAGGIEGLPILKGLGENDTVVSVWLDHLETALKGLQETT